MGSDLEILGEGACITMSRQALESVIGRAILDEEFRFVLYADPEAALAEYELTADEMAAMKAVDAESLDACASAIRSRVLGRLLGNLISG